VSGFSRTRNVQQFRLATWAVGVRRSIVITEEATNPLTAPDAAVLRLNPNALDQLVAKPLMVALPMIMDHEVGARTPEVPLTQRNHPIQAFLFDGPNKALRVRIGRSPALHLVMHISPRCLRLRTRSIRYTGRRSSC
jgi:hypothetical protein